MGSVYRRQVKFCRTCDRRLNKTAEHHACEGAGHHVESVTLSIWWIRYQLHGRPKFESTKTDQFRQAERMLKLREGDVERGVPVLPKAGLLRFEEAADDLLNDYRTNGKSTLVDTERRITKHLAPFFGGRRMATITTSDIRAFVAGRQTDVIVTGDGSRPVSHGEINREVAILKRMFNLAIQAEKLQHKPQIPLLREHNIRTGFFEAEQYRSVLRLLPEPIQPVVTFAYFTGWRIDSEILSMQWHQVDQKAGEVRLDPGTTKNRDGRVISLSPALKTLMDAQWAQREALKAKGVICPWVFHRNGKRITSIRIAWQKACLAAGCPGRIPHDLRRTAIRNMVRGGVPEAVAMKVSGHRTRSVFERYNIVSLGDLRDAARRGYGHTSGDTPGGLSGTGS